MVRSMNRRVLIEKALFGSGYLGLRALATGLPAWMFARPGAAGRRTRPPTLAPRRTGPGRSI